MVLSHFQTQGNKTSVMFLSVVVPVYNEEKRILKAIKALNSYLPRKKFKSEVIFVNDGSKDNTVSRIKKSEKKFLCKIVSYSLNHGKGYAIQQGIKEAIGEYILFVDVDMSTPIECFDRFIPFLKKKAHVIIGTRKAKGADVLIHQNQIRENMGKAYTFLSNIILGTSVSDFTCGFKCFSQKSAKKIFGTMKTKRWSFDSEILYLANKLRFKIREVPVTWSNDSDSRVNLVRDTVGSFLDLLKIRWYYLLPRKKFITRHHFQ